MNKFDIQYCYILANLKNNPAAVAQLTRLITPGNPRAPVPPRAALPMVIQFKVN